MFFQKEYIREGVSMTLNDTYRVDLPEHGLLSGILFRFSGDQVKPLGSTGGSWRLLDFLSKLTILANGATIVKSLKPTQIQALSFWDQGVMPPSVLRNYASNTQFEYFLVNFGRKLFDMEYGLDLARYDNVELQLTNIATSSYFTNMYISAMGVYLRDMPNAFKGHMRTEEWKSWTGVQNEYNYNELPTEHLLRRVMLQANPAVDSSTKIADTTFNNCMDDIELSLDTGQIRVFKGGLDDLARLNYYDRGVPPLVGGLNYSLADYGYDIGLGYVDKIVNGLASMDGAVHTEPSQLAGSETKSTQHNEYYAGDQATQFMASGVGPFNTGLLRFDYAMDPSTWLDVNARKTVKLDIHVRDSASADAGTNCIVLDRLVRY